MTNEAGESDQLDLDFLEYGLFLKLGDLALARAWAELIRRCKDLEPDEIARLGLHQRTPPSDRIRS